MAFNQIRLQNLFDNMSSYSDNQGFGDYSEPEPYGTSPEPWGFNQPTGEPPSSYPSSPPPPAAPTVIPANRAEPSMNWMDEMERRFHPETAATDRFNDLLNRFPTEGRPSLGRTIVASGMAAGQGGLENSQKFLHAPFIRDMAAWKEEAGPTYNAANLERQSNVNERQLLGSALTAQINQQKVDETLRSNMAKEETNRQKVQVANLIAQGWEEVDAPNSPTIILKQKNGTGILDTKVPRGSMTQMDLEAGRTARATAVAAQQGANQAASPLNMMSIGGRPFERNADGMWIPARVQGDPFGAAAAPTTGAGGPSVGPVPTPPTVTRIGTPPNTPPVSMLEKGRIELDRMRDLYQTDEEARNWIKNKNGIFSMGNRPQVTPASGIWPFNTTEITQEMVNSYDRTRQKIDPTYVPPTTPFQMPTPQQQGIMPSHGQTTQPVPGGGRGLGPANIPTGTPVGGGTVPVKVKTPDGRTGTVQWDYNKNGPLPAGWVEIQ